jgi:probable HAF family extracellular repeat protein
MNRFSLSLTALLVLWNAAGKVLGAAYDIIDLGSLGGDSYATAINAGGQVVGYSNFVSGGPNHAFLYSNGHMTDLGTLSGTWSYAYGINDSGQVVGYSGDPDANRHAFLYNNGHMTDLGTLGGERSEAYGINASGQVVGLSNHDLNGSCHAFLYTNGQMTDLGSLGGDASCAYGINDSGQVVGYADLVYGGPIHAFLYSGGQMSDLGTFLGSDQTRAQAINASGQVVGYSFIDSGHIRSRAFLYSSGVWTDLGTLGGEQTSAGGINARGQIVGRSSIDPGNTVPHAFLYSNGQMTDLNTLIDPALGWTLGAARGINDSGQIAGQGYHSGFHAFLMTPLFTWTGDGGPGSARWDVAANWDNNSVPVSVNVTFGASFSNGNTIDLSGARSAQVLTFMNTSSNDLTFINGTLSAAELGKQAGNGSVTFADTASISIAGGATIDTGALAIAGTMLTGSIRGTGNLRIDGTGRATIRATALPNDPASTSRLASFSIASGPVPTATLDLNNNSLILDYTDPLGSVLSNVTAQIASGRNGVDGNDQANWTGPGIITSAGRAANVAATYDLYNLGAINNADLDTMGLTTSYTAFGGQAVTPNTVLVKYTYSGDADLSGTVDGDDYTYWLLGLLNLTDPAIQGWMRGDFNYDGRVDGDDYTQWLNTFLLNGPPLAGSGPAPVPEPSTFVLLSTCALALLACGWRRGRR